MNLSLSPKKCEFLMTVGTVLGHSISQKGLQVDPNNIAIIQRVPPSQKQRDVRSFLGLSGYYWRFIKDFNKLASPLFGLLAKDSKFVWSKSCQEALDTLKNKLTTTSILRGPNWVLPFVLWNALATFQRAVLSIFAELVHDAVEIYMDDFTPYGCDFQEALSNLGELLHK